MKKTALIDKSFDRQRSSIYHESIQISLDGFCVFIRDGESGKIVYFDRFTQNARRYGALLRKIKEWFAENELLDLKCGSSKIVFHTEKYTVVPNQFFSEESAEEMLSFAFQRATSTSCIWNKLSQEDACVLFEMPSALRSFFQKRNSSSVLAHNIVPIVDDFLEQRREKEVVRIHAHQSNTYFDLLITIGNRLMHVSSFGVETVEDRLYFILAMIKEGRLNPETIEFSLSGVSDHFDEFLMRVQSYVANVKLIRLENMYQPLVTVSNLQEHQLYPLVKTIPCE